MDMKPKPPFKDSIMSIFSVALTAVNNFQPSSRQGVQFEGMVGDKAVNVRRNRDGGFIPAIGTEFTTPQGTAMITNHWGDQCVAEIIEFDEEYLFISGEGEDMFLQTADEYIADLAAAANRSRDSKVSDLKRLLTTPSGATTKECEQRIADIPVLEPTEFLISFAQGAELPEDVEVLVEEVVIARKTPKTRDRRVSVRELLDAVGDMLGETCPADIQDDIAAELDNLD